LLREDRDPICDHVELTTPARDHRGLEAGVVQQLGRDTRGLHVVAVSDGAVVDLDGHRIRLPARDPERPVDSVAPGKVAVMASRARTGT